MKMEPRDPARDEALVGEEEEIDIVELTDEDGVTTRFEYLSTVEHEGESYVVLMVLDEDEDGEDEEEDDEGEVVILKIEEGEDGEDMYVSCEDDETAQKVFELFLQELEEEDED